MREREERVVVYTWSIVSKERLIYWSRSDMQNCNIASYLEKFSQRQRAATCIFVQINEPPPPLL